LKKKKSGALTLEQKEFVLELKKTAFYWIKKLFIEKKLDIFQNLVFTVRAKKNKKNFLIFELLTAVQ